MREEVELLENHSYWTASPTRLALAGWSQPATTLYMP
jgi:hypothetical protein